MNFHSFSITFNKVSSLVRFVQSINRSKFSFLGGKLISGYTSLYLTINSDSLFFVLVIISFKSHHSLFCILLYLVLSSQYKNILKESGIKFQANLLSKTKLLLSFQKSITLLSSFKSKVLSFFITLSSNS